MNEPEDATVNARLERALATWAKGHSLSPSEAGSIRRRAYETGMQEEQWHAGWAQDPAFEHVRMLPDILTENLRALEECLARSMPAWLPGARSSDAGYAPYVRLV